MSPICCAVQTDGDAVEPDDRGLHAAGRRHEELHAEWPIGLQLEGSYHDLGMFLERVSKFPRIINVGGIKINARRTTGRRVDHHRGRARRRRSCCIDKPLPRLPAAARAGDGGVTV